jgi:hypothetical protein
MYLVFLISIIIGFAIGVGFSKHKPGKRALFHVFNVRIWAYIIHINHGHLALLLIVILLLNGYYNSVILGLLAGLALQGLTSKDLYAKV